MKYNPDIHKRRSIRLKDYDYSQAGAYFITICAQDRECLFGKITDGKMVLNDAGRMIEKWFFELENKFRDIQPDVHMVMPNHFHCIVINVGADLRVCPDSGENHDNLGERPDKLGERAGSSLHGHSDFHHDHSRENPNHSSIYPEKLDENRDNSGEHAGSPLRKIVQWYKTMTTNEYIKNVKINGWQPFNKKLWQRNYYDHIVRNEFEVNSIREYIINNPLQWDNDEENPFRNTNFPAGE